MATVNVNIRMDADDKAEFEELCAELGLTMNAAFNLFVKQALREQAIPFRITTHPGIQYMDTETLDRQLEEFERKHRKAYEELAK